MVAFEIRLGQWLQPFVIVVDGRQVARAQVILKSHLGWIDGVTRRPRHRSLELFELVLQA